MGFASASCERDLHPNGCLTLRRKAQPHDVRLEARDDGLVGQQLFAGEATRLAYASDEAAEGRDSFLEKRDPDWSSFPWLY